MTHHSKPHLHTNIQTCCYRGLYDVKPVYGACEKLSILWHGELRANVSTPYNGRSKYVIAKVSLRVSTRSIIFRTLYPRFHLGGLLSLIRRCCTLPINREMV
jgi:hypothetical protein